MVARLVVSVLLGAFVLGGAASASTLDKSWSIGTVTALDGTAQSIGAGIAWTPKSCEGVVLWLPGERARWTFRVPGACPATSTGRGVSAVAALDRRLLFLSYVGGNTREWRLWTVTPTSRRPRLIRQAGADADQPSPIVVGNAGEEGLPYAVGRDVVLLDSSGARTLTWRAPDDVTSLSEAAGLLAVTLGNGDVVVVQARGGGQVLRVPASGQRITGLRPIAGGVVVATTTGIDIHRSSGVTHLHVPAGARLAGDFDGALVYVLGNEIRMHTHRTDTDVLLRRVNKPVFVDADRRGMAWSVGSTLCWTVRVSLTYRNDLAPACS